MGSIVKLSTKLLLTGLALAITMPCVLANTLSEVQVNADATSGYDIVLKTDESTQMKKVVSSNDRMYIELKNVQVSENLNTVYNNVANIDNVTIQPTSKNDIKIILKGKDISQSKVHFETIKTTLPVESQTQAIELSKPVTSYTPVFNPESLTSDDSQTSNPQLNETLTKMHVTREMLVSVKTLAKKAINKTKSGDINFMSIVGILIIAGAFIFRPKKRAVQAPAQRPANSGLGLSAAAMDREIGINRAMAGNMNVRPQGVNPAAAGYGMKAYQQSQKNPYMTANTPSNGISGIARKSSLRQSAPIKKQPVSQRPVEQAPLRQAPLRQTAKMNNPIQSKAPALKQPAARQSEPSDLDSVKFLESITKIYEKNGRTDLAKGLKDNLRKAQMTRQVV